MGKYAKIPEATVRRLSNYLKCLEDLEQKGEKVASSALIALICNVNAAQVRKDFAYFGEFGIRGMGYSVKELRFHIREILGTNREWRIAVVGSAIGKRHPQVQGFPQAELQDRGRFDQVPVQVIGHFSEKMGSPSRSTTRPAK
jgi:redox-sensing transcriptional repressor